VAAGDSRGAEQILDRGRVVAFFVAAGDEGGEEPLALVTPRRVPIAAAAGWQPAISHKVSASPHGVQIPHYETFVRFERGTRCTDR
jgi:hypothetical protein